jgi:hypothetical protein
MGASCAEHRCPTECFLSYADEPWRCVVSLRFIGDESSGNVRNISFGDPIFAKADVTERIRRAQRAILNPSTNPQDFLNNADEDPEERELTFSSNCVCLHISGKDVADLSFVDLPGRFLAELRNVCGLTFYAGLIASVGRNGQESDIELIKSLAATYIQRESCIILLTIACESKPSFPFHVNVVLMLEQPILRIRVHTAWQIRMIQRVVGP